MRAGHDHWVQRYLRQAVSTLATVSLSVVVTVFVMRALTPQHAHAQAAPGVVQATEVDLIAPNGAISARLQTAGTGDGNLTLYDNGGHARVVLSAVGALLVNDANGVTPRFAAGYTEEFYPQGVPPFDGVLFDANGSEGSLP
jgi:hypothetical protein